MIQFYKPNAKVTGTACSFWANADGSMMSSLIKQARPPKQNPFAGNKDNPDKRVITKLNPVEIGGIIDAMERGGEWSNFHSSENQQLQLKFAPYESGAHKGFSFSVYRQDKTDSTNKVSFAIGFTFAEARYLKEFLIYSLRLNFDKQNEEYKKKQKEKFKKIAKEKKQVKEETNSGLVVEEDEEDLW
jgi:uncharacterized protein YfcZ (UPF0381/DUF406 family)